MTDGVEAGSGTTENSTKLLGVASLILLPIVNGLLAKIGVPALDQSTLQVALVSIAGLCAAFIGARTWRKTNAAKNGMQDAATAQMALEAAKALPDTDPKKGEAVAAAIKAIGA